MLYRPGAGHFLLTSQMQASQLQPNTKASDMQSHVLEMIQHLGIATAKHLLFYGGAIRAKIIPALFLDSY